MQKSGCKNASLCHYIRFLQIGSYTITNQAFVVTSMNKSPCHRKCTVAAVYNLSVQVLPNIGNVWGKFLGGHILLVYSWIEVVSILRWLRTIHVWLHHKN